MQILKQHRSSGRLSDNNPPVSLLNIDANKISSFEVGDPNKGVLVYCWDRGLGPPLLAALAKVALRSPSVRGALCLLHVDLCFNCIFHCSGAGFICERSLHCDYWEPVTPPLKIAAGKVNASVRVWKKREGIEVKDPVKHVQLDRCGSLSGYCQEGLHRPVSGDGNMSFDLEGSDEGGAVDPMSEEEEDDNDYDDCDDGDDDYDDDDDDDGDGDDGGDDGDDDGDGDGGGGGDSFDLDDNQDDADDVVLVESIDHDPDVCHFVEVPWTGDGGIGNGGGGGDDDGVVGGTSDGFFESMEHDPEARHGGIGDARVGKSTDGGIGDVGVGTLEKSFEVMKIAGRSYMRNLPFCISHTPTHTRTHAHTQTPPKLLRIRTSRRAMPTSPCPALPFRCRR